MSAGFYMDRDCLLRGLHPVSRILLLLLSFAAALIFEHPAWVAGLWLFFILVSLRTGVWPAVRRVAWLMLLVGFASFLVWSFAYPGSEALLRFGPLKVSRQGMLYGAGMGLRLDLMVFCGLVFLAVTPVEEFMFGLSKMGVPFPVGFALSLSFRLVPLFLDTLSTIVEAQKARGLDLSEGWFGKRVKNYIPLLAPVFASALRRADLLALALESKGFGFSRRRGSLKAYRAGAGDALSLILMVLLIGLCAWARTRGLGLVE